MRGNFKKCVISKLIYTDNKSMENVIGIEVITREPESQNGKYLLAYMVKGNKVEQEWLYHTSTIREINVKGNQRTVKTEHSTYVFERTAYALSDMREVYKVNLD